MPPMTADGMCPECAEPGRHSPAITFNLADGTTTGGPCPAWPRWARQADKLHAELRQWAARRKTGPPASAPGPPPAKTGPVAVITLSGPIEDLTAKLAAIQASHPGAQIRPGKRNQWEIWPPGSRTAPKQLVRLRTARRRMPALARAPTAGQVRQAPLDRGGGTRGADRPPGPGRHLYVCAGDYVRPAVTPEA